MEGKEQERGKNIKGNQIKSIQNVQNKNQRNSRRKRAGGKKAIKRRG